MTESDPLLGNICSSLQISEDNLDLSACFYILILFQCDKSNKSDEYQTFKHSGKLKI